MKIIKRFFTVVVILCVSVMAMSFTAAKAGFSIKQTMSFDNAPDIVIYYVSDGITYSAYSETNLKAQSINQLTNHLKNNKFEVSGGKKGNLIYKANSIQEVCDVANILFNTYKPIK